MTIKSTITKRIVRGKRWLKQFKKKKHQKRQNWREREREKEREFTFFVVKNLEGIREKGGNEVKEIYMKINLEEEE